MLELPTPLAVACHDAGAANIILAWLAAEPELDMRPVMQGPALAGWRERFGPRPAFASAAEALEGASALLSGTGWASDLEHDARALARDRGIRSVAVLDHWVNYRPRFRRGGREVLPDEIWVTDRQARALAGEAFPELEIALRPNLYLDEQVARVSPWPAGRPSEILYVLEPARSDWGRNEPGEFQALDYFFARRAALGLPADAPVRLRPHPSESPEKYEAWLRRRPELGAEIDRSGDLAAALSGADWVAGCESFALVVALAAQRKVVCTLPPWAPQCSLPQSGLIHLKAIA
jgi:hypothetical protein